MFDRQERPISSPCTCAEFSFLEYQDDRNVATAASDADRQGAPAGRAGNVPGRHEEPRSGRRLERQHYNLHYGRRHRGVTAWADAAGVLCCLCFGVGGTGEFL